jgi:hypothetical protein
MFKKKFEIQPKKFEVSKTSYVDETLITSVQAIEEGGLMPERVEDLEKLVEAPLLDACKILYNKGIETIFTSANKKDVLSGYAHIAIDYEKLSEENKKIALTLGELGKAHGSIERQAVYVKIPINENSTVGEIRKDSIRIAQEFKQQL